jgi:3-hydroxyisobutyrate dehydrogenase-like beta-hydroxyacid dehydrogenase
MTEKIGFIGLGLMGHGMAGNLLEKGYPLTAVVHRNRAPLEDLVPHGATESASAREVAERSDIVIICVTGAPQVEEVVYGDEGLLQGVGEGKIVMDCSTSEPDTTARVSADIASRGAQFADAPLARTPIEAEAGRLNTMVGASEETFAVIKPVLECFCENIFHVGPVGAGHKTKLINNFLAMGHAALIGEALCACVATGVDPRKYYEVVTAGGANSGIFQLIVPKALDEGDYSGLKFSLANAAKDLRYYTRMTESVPLTGNLGNAVHHALVQGLNLGFDDGFVGDLIRAQAKLNRIDFPGD